MHIMISSTQVDALEVPKPNNKHPPRMGDDATTAIPKIKTRTMLSRGGLLPMRPLVSVGDNVGGLVVLFARASPHLVQKARDIRSRKISLGGVMDRIEKLGVHSECCCQI